MILAQSTPPHLLHALQPRGVGGARVNAGVGHRKGPLNHLPLRSASPPLLQMHGLRLRVMIHVHSIAPVAILVKTYLLVDGVMDSVGQAHHLMLVQQLPRDAKFLSIHFGDGLHALTNRSRLLLIHVSHVMGDMHSTQVNVFSAMLVHGPP
jgi:hypothetical protein